MDKAKIAGIIDHSLLKPTAISEDIKKLCNEARQYGFYSVCINPFFVSMAKEFLSGSDVKISTVIGFPFGMTLPEVKVYEAVEAVSSGADELDIVMNIGMAKIGKWDIVKNDISDIISATKGVIHKIIIETCYLSHDEKIKASNVMIEAGAEFIKTSTGFGTGGATVEDVRLIKSVAGDACKIKAAGGIKNLFQVREMIKAGAARIGTSAGVAIIIELSEESI